jgi:hypothetical protein
MHRHLRERQAGKGGILPAHGTALVNRVNAYG